MIEVATRTALSAEFEMVFAEPGSEIEEQARANRFEPLNDDVVLGRPSSLSDAAAEMLSAYSSLRPASDEEAVTRDRWIEYVTQGVTSADVVNFRLYAALSEPCLTYPTYPLGTTYTEITQNAGQLEFRGPGKRQEGWYDRDNISEQRLSPATRSQFEWRRVELLSSAVKIASAEGHRVFLGSQHINGSSYIGETPVLGEMDNLDPYLAAVAGLRRVLLEGGLLNPARYPRSHRAIKFGSQRDDNVRVMPGRVEYRGIRGYDGPDYANGVRFLNAGLLYAEHTTDDERSRVFTVDMLQVTPLDGYRKESDLYLRRLIESCTMPSWELPKGQNYVLAGNDPDHNHEVLAAVTGRPFTSGYYPEANVLFTHAVKLGDDGFLYTDRQLMAELRQICSLNPAIGFADIPAINAKLRQLRVKPVTQIYHTVHSIANKHTLHGLRSAVALPLVAPEDHAELLAAFRDE